MSEYFFGLPELTKHEKDSIPYFITVIQHRPEVWTSNSGLMEQVIRICPLDLRLNGVRMRKILNYIRTHRMLKGVLIAGKRGYKLTFDADEVRKYLKSLDYRIEAQQYLRDNIFAGLNEILN